ncbi:MAG: YdiU family protein [Gammaproteobacteria bacterium]|nr:YdiU family protein [Gammaproteobacteria bacterium]
MKFSNSYIHLGDLFYEKINPQTVTNPEIFLWNEALADELNIQDSQQLAQFFSGNRILPGSEPLALAYAGHQFGNFVPQLGDGRAHLLGEVIDQNGNRKDIQLKGSGQTRFSRNGDGRCAFGPAIREFIMSEAMYALGISTTRSLAVTTTGETVFRETPQPGAVITRVASSHLRVGTFQYFAAQGNYQAIEKLCDYAIDRHYPELKEAGDQRFQELLKAVIDRQTRLVVEWLRVGFIHGVMNTDNTSIAGETIDYGPCAMLGVYDHKTVYSSIDVQGRYAFGNQPTIAQWNMARLAETLLPLIHAEEQKSIEIASSLVDEFSERFQTRYITMMAAKTGFSDPEENDYQLVSEFQNLLEEKQLDYTITFNALTRSLSSQQAQQHMRNVAGDWFNRWINRMDELQENRSDIQKSMQQVNPVVIPRNHHVENVINTCIQTRDAQAANEFIDVLKSPYAETIATGLYQDAPTNGDMGYKTFCGT